jgi:hypothetical protein
VRKAWTAAEPVLPGALGLRNGFKRGPAGFAVMLEICNPAVGWCLWLRMRDIIRWYRIRKDAGTRIYRCIRFNKLLFEGFAATTVGSPTVLLLALTTIQESRTGYHHHPISLILISICIKN